MNALVPISDSYIGPASGTSPSVWPRRASRACASCRRDKIRCDGTRPCNACVKKGYPAGQCTDGCEPCRRARVRCEEGNGKPCKRCREMNVHCVDGPLAPNTALANTQLQSGQVIHRPVILGLTSNPPHEGGAQGITTNANGNFGRGSVGSAADQTTGNSNSPGKLSRGTERAKLACVGCRRDNKKCDDHRPCSRCLARSEECIHVTRGPKLVKLRCEGCREENKKCEESRPCKYCVDSEKECVNVPRKGRGHGTRVKSACVSCRRDKIRCNGDRPCAPCVKKGCECIERACTSCVTEGKGSECIHKRSTEGASPVGAPASDTPSPSNSKISSTTTVKEKEYHFVPSEDDSRWISFATSSGTQTSPIIPPNMMFSGQQHGVVPPANGYYYYPEAGMSNNQVMPLQTPSLTTMMQHNIYGHSTSNPAATYFFDAFDPGNYQLTQHMTNSNNRTFLSGN